MAEQNLSQNQPEPVAAQSAELSHLTIPAMAGVVEDERSMAYLGVLVQKGAGGPNVPERARFGKDTITLYDLQLMQKIALAWELGEPLLIEGGSGIGKTRAIERMCAQCNFELFYANCHDFDSDTLIGAKTVREDTRSGFGWKDGIVMQAARGANPPVPNHVRVLVMDEFNYMSGETRGRLHEILDTVLSGKNKIYLIENDGEVVTVPPGLLIVCLQNPPGNRYEDREILDEAQLTRMTYQKEPSSMPEKVMLDRALGGIGKAPPPEISPRSYLPRAPGLTREQVSEIPGITEALTRFVEFYASLDQMTRGLEIAEDQPQPVYFSFQRDYERLMKYIEKHFNGDLNDTVARGLTYFFANKFESEEDRAKVQELIAHVGYFPERESLRKTLSDYAAQNDDRLEAAALEQDRMRFVERLQKSAVSDAVVAAALCGLECDEAWELRVQLMQAGIDRNKIAEGLSGTRSLRSFEMRDALLRQGADPELVANSLAGDGSQQAWELRERLAEMTSPEKILGGIVGLDCGQARKLRVRLCSRSLFDRFRYDSHDLRLKRDAVAISLAGLDTPHAWGMRDWLEKNGASASAIAQSIAGVDSDQAWDMRERFYQEGMSSDSLARTLIGLDSDRAWKFRERFEKRNNLWPQLLSITGLKSERAEKVRREALKSPENKDMVAASFGGNFLSVGIESLEPEA